MISAPVHVQNGFRAPTVCKVHMPDAVGVTRTSIPDAYGPFGSRTLPDESADRISSVPQPLI